MHITAGKLLKYIPPASRGNIPGHKALEIVHAQYCGPMTVRGFCTAVCDTCRPALQEAFSLEGAKNEQAVLTWRLKTALSKAQDSAGQHQAEKRTDAYGLPVSEGNPFLALKKQYEKPTAQR